MLKYNKEACSLWKSSDQITRHIFKLRCNMLEKGDLVIYGAEGICRVLDINTQSFQEMNNTKVYYILEPLENQSGKLFVPVDNETLCKRI